MTKEQMDTEYNTNIQNIRANYEGQGINHEEYHNQLNAESKRYKNELAIYFPTEPPRDLAAEIDDLKAKLKQQE